VTFDLQPFLKGKLLELRPLRADDFDALYAAASDPLIWEQHPSPDRCEKEVFKKFFDGALDCSGTLIAIDSQTGQVVGSSRFSRYDAAQSEIEIGFSFLARSHWGGTYNREMKELMLTHAFKFVNNAYFLVGPNNLRSRKAMEKIGGIEAGSRIDANGRDSIAYRITASAFTAK
jgi:RimJ/RimL family protein N-acetyltransferase